VFAHLLLEETFSYVQSNEYSQKAHIVPFRLYEYMHTVYVRYMEVFGGIVLLTYARVERGFLRGIRCIISIL
jgi:hypothetical protein